MARFETEGTMLALEFNPLERLGGLRRGARVPLADVASVEVVDDPWTVASGLRVGTGIPWVILLGTMLRSGPNDVLAIYGRPAGRGTPHQAPSRSMVQQVASGGTGAASSASRTAPVTGLGR